MAEEARFTQSLDRKAIMARKGYRSLPVQFIKAKEVYDPSDFIRSLAERRRTINLDEKTGDDTNMKVIEERLHEIEVSKVAKNLIKESDNDSDSDEQINEFIETTISADNNIIHDDVNNDLDNIPIDDFEVVENDDIISMSDMSDESQGKLSDLSTHGEKSFPEASDITTGDKVTAKLKDENSDNYESESDSESDFDENDISAMAFLVNRPMEGGDDIYIPPSAPTVKPKKSKFSLKNIKKIIQTDMNSDEELEFKVQRVAIDKSIVVDTVKYSQIAEENDHITSVEELNNTIRSLGGMVSGYDINDKGKKPPTEVSKMIEALSKFQGQNNKRTRKAARELAEIAAEVEPTYNHSLLKKSKRTPSFSAADPSLRKQLTEAWIKARNSQAFKKKEREELRKAGKLTKEYKKYETIPLECKYPSSMTIYEIVHELETFVNSCEKTSMPFPPMVKKYRAVIADLSKAYYLTTNSVGKGKEKQVVCTKTSKTVFAHRDVGLIEFITKSFSFKKFVVSTDPNTGDKEAAKKQKRALRAVKGGSSRQFQEGELVGANADKIEAGNIGRQMLQKLGWSEGMTLGHTNSGIAVPISMKIKNTKYGVGF